jgi:hypothetical protein
VCPGEKNGHCRWAYIRRLMQKPDGSYYAPFVCEIVNGGPVQHQLEYKKVCGRDTIDPKNIPDPEAWMGCMYWPCKFRHAPDRPEECSLGKDCRKFVWTYLQSPEGKDAKTLHEEFCLCEVTNADGSKEVMKRIHPRLKRPRVRDDLSDADRKKREEELDKMVLMNWPGRCNAGKDCKKCPNNGPCPFLHCLYDNDPDEPVWCAEGLGCRFKPGAVSEDHEFLCRDIHPPWDRIGADGVAFPRYRQYPSHDQRDDSRRRSNDRSAVDHNASGNVSDTEENEEEPGDDEESSSVAAASNE